MRRLVEEQASSREELARLVEQQKALRRVATLVAQRAPPASLFAVVAEEVARVLDVPVVSVVRYEADGTATERATFSERGELFAVGTRWSLDGTSVPARVRETGQPARINDYAGLEGTIAETVRRLGIRSRVGVPITVAGRLWGAMVASSEAVEPLPADTEARLAEFSAAREGPRPVSAPGRGAGRPAPRGDARRPCSRSDRSLCGGRT